MKVIYYFNPKRRDIEKDVIREIYGSAIQIVNEKPWRNYEVLEEGDILICEAVNELAEDIGSDTENIIREYLSLVDHGIELVFDKSVQCNSLFIKTLQGEYNNFETVLRKCVTNYQTQRNIEKEYQKKHVFSATRNGNRVGVKEGTRIITKKSLETKKIIEARSREFNGNETDESILKDLNISRNTYFKYKKELRAEKGATKSWHS